MIVLSAIIISVFLYKKEQPVQLHKKSVITVCAAFDGTITLKAKGRKLDYKEILKLRLSKKQPERKEKISFIYPHATIPGERKYGTLLKSQKEDISKEL